jgi:hypothetical protein
MVIGIAEGTLTRASLLTDIWPPKAYEDIPAVSQATCDACVAWAEATARLKAAEAATTV